jgi:hypothetical protein
MQSCFDDFEASRPTTSTGHTARRPGHSNERRLTMMAGPGGQAVVTLFRPVAAS